MHKALIEVLGALPNHTVSLTIIVAGVVGVCGIVITPVSLWVSKPDQVRIECTVQ